jgi:hypothetical protein
MMRWISIIFVIFISLLLTTSLFAKTSVLIDFDKLKANGDGDPKNSLAVDDPKMKDAKDHDAKKRIQHMPTLVSYGDIAGSSFSQAEKDFMKISLAAYNWDVTLNSSAAFVENTRFSKAIEWHTKAVSILADNTADAGRDGFTILGARIKFPEWPYNCNATIKPPFEIPAFDDILTNYKGEPETDAQKLAAGKYKKFDGYGMVNNVGTIKSMKMKVYGLQFQNSISVLLKDDLGVITEYSFPEYLNFDGWREITWNNPAYIDSAANRSLYFMPLYPHSEPYVTLYAFRVYRQGDKIGGDFVVYIKDVKITYDLAVLDRDEPIDNEAAWQIISSKVIESKRREMTKLGQGQILRFLEKKKMDSTAP